MTEDVRIAVGLPGHPKTKKLHKRLGGSGCWSLVCLYLWTAQNHTNGVLSGMSSEDIELAVNWTGDDGAFVDALIAVRFLDFADGTYSIHDWSDHNPWVTGADLRSKKGQWNAIKRHHGIAEADRQVPEYAAIRLADANATPNPDSNASSMLPALHEDDPSNAPSPYPYPKEQKQEPPPVGGNGAEEPKTEPKPPAIDPKAALWSEWKKLSNDSGAYLSKLIKIHGEGTVLDAVIKVLDKNPAEPKAYIQRILAPNPGKAGRVDQFGWVLDEYGNQTKERGAVI